MSHNFSVKELLLLRKRKAKPDTTTPLTAEAYKRESEVVSLTHKGDTVLARLKKYAHIKSMLKLPEVEANRLPGVVGGKHIAVCLVIVDRLNHEEIWKRWMQQSVECGYETSLHIHAKHPDRITSSWVRSHTLDHTYSPEWNSPEVIRAVLAVITDALKNPNTGRLVLGTESCIPIMTLKEAGDRLFAEEVSWLQAYHKGKHTYEEQKCFWAVDRTLIPPEYVWKALPGWVTLTRKHAEAITSLPAKVNCPDFVVGWNIVHAPEEVYFPTMLALLGYLRDPSRGPDEVRRQCPTYSEWKKASDANPITYESLTPELLSYLRGTGAIFARKFRADTVTADHWDAVVRAAAGQMISTTRDTDGKAGSSSSQSTSAPRKESSSSAPIDNSGIDVENTSSKISECNTSTKKLLEDTDCDSTAEPASKRVKPDII